MTTKTHQTAGQRALVASLALGAALMAAAPAALAQDAPIITNPQRASAPAVAISPNATINLIRLLVKQGVISQQSADDLVRQAETEATLARAMETASAQVIQAPGAAPPPNVVRVPYVPQIVKDQIRDELRVDVMTRAQEEGWASKGLVPKWVNRVEWSGDFRFRNQSELYSASNVDEMVDFATFNGAGPIDVNDLTNPGGIPFLNTRKNRPTNLNLRARLGLKATLGEATTLGIRLASGKDSSPVSTTQALGGGFSKKDIWLDQAYLTIQPTARFGGTVGRMPNPFVHTDLVFDDDLNFDGVSLNTATYPADRNLNVYGVAGAFPLESQTSNFPTNSAVKAKDRSKWLLAAQAGVQWKPGDVYSGRLLPVQRSRRRGLGALRHLSGNPPVLVRPDPASLYAEGQHGLLRAGHHPQSRLAPELCPAPIRGPVPQV